MRSITLTLKASHAQVVVISWEQDPKMSKSLGNTVSPGEMVEKYGADTVRLFILFGANPEAGMEWSDTAIDSNHRHLVSIIDAFEASLSMKESKGD